MPVFRQLLRVFENPPEQSTADLQGKKVAVLTDLRFERVICVKKVLRSFQIYGGLRALFSAVRISAGEWNRIEPSFQVFGRNGRQLQRGAVSTS